MSPSLPVFPNTDWSWGPLLFDMDNDGKKDLFIANGIKRDFINLDFLIYYAKRSNEMQKTGKVNMGEFITDVLNKWPSRRKNNYFFRNNGDLTFEKMNGIWAKDILTCSNGAAYADFDNDGDVDIVVNNSDTSSFIYKNNATELGLGNYLEVRLKGPSKNPLGIGAKVTLYQQGKIQVLEQYLTRGFLSSVSPILHFGLGTDKIIPEIQVIWPDGKEQIIKEISADQLITLNYSEAQKSMIFPNLQIPGLLILPNL